MKFPFSPDKMGTSLKPTHILFIFYSINSEMTARLKKIVCYNTYVGFYLFQSTLEIQKAVLNQLESYFGNQVQNAFVQFLIKDWTTEPDVGGGPVNYMAPGQMHNFHELRQGPLRYLDK